MKRSIRLIFIALLEFVWIIISVVFFSVFVWGSIQSFGLLGIVSGLFIGLLGIAGIGGLIFLLIEVYYTLRSIEHALDDIQSLKPTFEKLVKIQYSTYEMFHDYLVVDQNSDLDSSSSYSRSSAVKE